MPIVLAPCVVQGAQAAPTIVAALRRLDAHPEVDVIITGRGGGSIEDLWAFNEEAVVRAIAACSKPVVSAVGHETDITLADFVADVRAKTPTAAGELVVPVQAELVNALGEYRLRLDRALDLLLDEARERLKALARHRALATPGHQLALRRQRLDELRLRLDDGMRALADERAAGLRLLHTRLEHASPARRIDAAREALTQNRRHLVAAATHHLAQVQERFAGLAARLDALSPLAVIARGYSVVRDANGRLVRRTDQVPAGGVIEARLPDGWLRAQVIGHRAQRLGEPETPYQA
jgi:exodeoxyribonuclease VII large subunit